MKPASSKEGRKMKTFSLIIIMKNKIKSCNSFNEPRDKNERFDMYK